MRPQSKSRRALPMLIGAVLVIAVLGGVWWLRAYMGKAAPATKKVVQEVQIVRAPPPPDTPPPPPPPEDKVDIPDPQSVDQPDPTPSDEPPPGEQLGVDAEGSGAGDGFGLLGRKGGRDLLASGGSAYSWYAGQMKNQLLELLSNEPKIRSGSYTVIVKVWVRGDGSIDRVALSTGSGDRERDRLIESALSRVTRLTQPPPVNMPMPVSLRIVSRA